MIPEYYPHVDPFLDVLVTIGFAVGLIAALYLRMVYYESPWVWTPFIFVALAFGFLGAEGGVLDVFSPGMLRAVALIILIGAELVGLISAIRPAPDRI